jgi:hypothetical protein
MAYKINFCDFWPGFDDNNLLLKFLKEHFDVVLSDKPDYIFFSVHGRKHLEYNNCIKIFYSGENITPNFNHCDYAIGSHYIDFEDRYVRIPLYVIYYWYYKKNNAWINNLYRKYTLQKDQLFNRKFCNFIYSNNVNSDPNRDLFFEKLSKYKKVDSGGKHLNNIGSPVRDKMEFISKYKFTIAFENSSVPGYTTEKIFEPMLANSLPIYYGNPLIHEDFNINSFINVQGESDFDRAIDEIKFLDSDKKAYIEKLSIPKLINEKQIFLFEQKLKEFVSNIFSQDMVSAKRLAQYGYNIYQIKQDIIFSSIIDRKLKKNKQKEKIKRLFRI